MIARNQTMFFSRDGLGGPAKHLALPRGLSHGSAPQGYFIIW